jgi:hypothetical protein
MTGVTGLPRHPRRSGLHRTAGLSAPGPACRRAFQRPAQGEAIGRHHLDGTREVGNDQVVEEPALRKARVRQQIAVALGLASKDLDEIGAGEQARHPDVAAEELVDHRHQADVVAGQGPHQRTQHPGSVLAGQDGDGCFPQGRVPLPGARGPVPGGRGPVHGGEETRSHPERGPSVSGEGGLEGSGHPQSVLVLGEAFVGLGRRKRPLGHQVVLVGGEHHAPPDGGEERLLPLLHRVADRSRLASGVRSHRLLLGEPAHPEGHAGHRGQRGVAVEHAGEGVGQDRSVVLAGAHHHLPVDLDAALEQGLEPPQAGRPAAVPQQLGADVGIGGVDGHEQRAEPLGQHPLEVHLGEPGERGEVAVEEREAVVVVLQGQAAPHPLGKLVDEAELAMIVAGADPVEHGRADFCAQRLALRLGHRQGQRLGHPLTADHQVQLGLVDQQAVLDDVTG